MKDNKPDSAKSVSIVIPTYNEKNNLGGLIQNIEQVLSSNKIDGELIIIDDNSPDGTGKLADSFARKYRNITVLHRAMKEGVGSARKLGFSKAKKEIILSMEGDDTHNPDYIPVFLREIEGADLVIGSRYLPGSKIVNWPFKRRLVSKVANFIARFFSGAKLTDVTSGFRAFRKGMYERLLIESYGYPFNMEFACEAASRGFSVKEIPIRFANRKSGKSKLNVLKELYTFIYVAFKFSYTYKPITVFGGIGLVFSLIGFVLGIYLAYLKITTGFIANRLPLLFLSALLIIAGIQMVSLGLVAGILTKLRKEKL